MITINRTICSSIILILIELYRQIYGMPTLEDTPLASIEAESGDEVLLDCVVRHLDNYTVIWRRTLPKQDTELLTVGVVQITNDKRISVLHRPEHDIWLLRIYPAQAKDSGRYICEVNTSPAIKVYRALTVIDDTAEQPTPFPLSHNYSTCCAEHGVPASCSPLCSLRSLVLDGPPSSVWQCTNYLPIITQCLADGRNHMPCCIEQNIPEVCRSVCNGNYQLSTVLQHYTCASYTLPALACIAQGVEILPGPPQQLTLDPISPNEIRIQWVPPDQRTPVTKYQINVTELNSFDSLGFIQNDLQETPNSAKEVLLEDAGVNSNITGSSGPTLVYVVNGSETSFVVENLKPLTMYQVRMVSINQHGTSLPTYAVRTLTLLHPEQPTEKTPTKELHLPNIRKCCEENGVESGRCINILCDPVNASETRLTDIMICAPWANVTFDCMAGGVDHTECCERRGIIGVCLDFCKGNITRLDYRHFNCLEHMGDYGSCLLEHYGVIPGPPEEFNVRSIHPHWAVLYWNPPKTLADTVTGYSLFWREATIDGRPEYQVIKNVKPPFLLDGLDPFMWYEMYVVAVNQYGTSSGSVRALFATPPPLPKGEIVNPGADSYNETACCVSAGLRDHCMPLCSYQVKLSELQLLAPLCIDDLQILVRCGAGGRDHTPCCERLDVPEGCLSLCSGHMNDSPVAIAFSCARAIGKILQCMSDGSDILPSSPDELHTINITSTSISLSWKPPENSTVKITGYQVRYSLNDNNTLLHPSQYNKTLNVTTTEAVIDGLQPNTSYSVYVVSSNDNGYSLPSLVILVHTPLNGSYNKSVHAKLSSPHSIEVLHQTVDSIALYWQPPIHVPVDAFLSYLIYYQPANSSSDLLSTTSKLATTFTSITINNLQLNTEYEIAVQARTGREESEISEIILAWTDPAIPALVNHPVIIPAGPITENSNITILCIGMGIPIPTVSVYINGLLVSQEQQRHLAHTIMFIQRNVTNVACYADNGYGAGAYSSVDVSVSFKPIIHSATQVVAAFEGSPVRLQCLVLGHPEPRILWYKDREHSNAIKRTSNVEIFMAPHEEETSAYDATLIIHKTSKNNEGAYYCYAENIYGTATLSLSLKLRKKVYRNASECCIQQGVKKECLDACSFDIDIQAAISKPDCMQDLDKLMYCAADGSDHQHCCRQRGVPRTCLKWCKGRSVINAPLCVLAAAREIVNCFEEGKAVLPGPPQEVHVQQLSENTLEVNWNPPQKNPQSVQWYRIFWRPVGSRDIYKNQTYTGPMKLKGLQPGLTYEVGVKAGNHYGQSLLTDPVVITLHGAEYKTYTGGFDNGTVVKTSVGVVTAIVLIAAAVGFGFYFRRRIRPKPTNGVSFDNPTYLKDHITLQSTSLSSEQNNINGDASHNLGQKDIEISPRAVGNIYEEPKSVH